MPTRRQIVSGGIAFGFTALGATPLLAARSPIRSATAIARVFGDGQKLIAIAVEYNAPINGASLSVNAYRGDGRRITAVYASTSADQASRAARGRFVIVELSPEDPAALLRVGGPPGGGGPPPQPGAATPPAAPMGPPRNINANYKPASASIIQTRAIRSVSGRIIPPSPTAIVTSQAKNLLVDEFRQFSFTDPATGDRLAYNLFLPKGYDRTKSYPLVLFMHDAGATSKDPLVTLKQGLGAVIWADPAEQAKRPCIVLAPQWDSMVVNDNSEATSMLDTTVHLVEKIASEYAVDRARIYSTGQSGGAMMTIAISIKYPDLLAASFIVAGQWDATLVKPMAQDKMWIVVSQGDLKAYPGQNAITTALEAEGAKVSRAVWDGRLSSQQFAPLVSQMEAQGNAINYVALLKGTVVPAGQNDSPGGNHVNTWRIAYTIEGIREWLFRQHK
jgi:predicted peptidase